MSYLQPTVRQLQPLGRRHHSAPVAPEEVDAHARAADTVSPNATTSASSSPPGGTGSPRARPCPPELASRSLAFAAHRSLAAGQDLLRSARTSPTRRITTGSLKARRARPRHACMSEPPRHARDAKPLLPCIRFDFRVVGRTECRARRSFRLTAVVRSGRFGTAPCCLYAVARLRRVRLLVPLLLIVHVDRHELVVVAVAAHETGCTSVPRAWARPREREYPQLRLTARRSAGAEPVFGSQSG
jgi:hypothetical protein